MRRANRNANRALSLRQQPQQGQPVLSDRKVSLGKDGYLTLSLALINQQMPKKNFFSVNQQDTFGQQQ